MAIKGFKTIEDQKGYKLDSKDREIFERELKESLFGNSGTSWNVYGNTDMIEFVLYDSNDNQLPQGESGHLVRYINLDDDNIQKYFRISEDIEDIKMNGAKEFLVDTEVLIKEAGYSNGIFKTQITLVNRRAGSEVIPHDRLWIHEISPSRTEIRVLPVNQDKGGVLPDLAERYEVYTEDGDFRDDTIGFVQEYVENVNVTDVFNYFLKIKGKVSDGQGYVNLIKKEFKVQDFGKYILDVKTLFVKAMKYWVENKDPNVNSGNFGKALTTTPAVQLSVEEIEDMAVRTLTDIIDKLLNKRDILEKAQLSQEDQVTFDEVEQLLQESLSDSEYESTLPPSISAKIRGCTDPNAENFNPDAEIDNGSCIYPLPPIDLPEPEEVVPEVDPEDDADTRDDTRDGTRDGPIIRTKNYWVHSDVGSIFFTSADGVPNTHVGGLKGQKLTISFQGVPRFEGDIRTYAVEITRIQRCNDPMATNYGQQGRCYYRPIDIVSDPRTGDGDITTRGGSRAGVGSTFNIVEDSITRYPSESEIIGRTEYYIPPADGSGPETIETYTSTERDSTRGRVRIIRETL